MTYRDANANDLTGFLDMAALQAGWPKATIPAPDLSTAPGPSVPHQGQSGDLPPGAVPPADALS